MQPVTIYSTTYCPYCKRAKALLNQLNVPYEEINLEDDPTLRDELTAQYNWHTVPMIMIGGEFIGGFDDLNRLHVQGELMEKLEQ